MIAVATVLAFQLVWRAQAPLPQPRAALLQAVFGGRVLTAGGTYWIDDRKYWSTRCDFFDPRTNTWSSGASLPMPRADSAVVEVGGKLLFLGGTSEGRVLDDVLAFNGTAWRVMNEMRLPGPRSYPQSAVVDRRIYLFGGLETAGDITTARSDVWMWNLDRPADGWQHVSKMPEPARINYAFTLLDGKAYLFGGVAPSAGGFRNLSEAWSYDFRKNDWVPLPAIPVATRAWAAAVWRNCILLLGGYTDQFSSTVLSFSPKSREFTYSGSLPRGIADARFLSIDGDLFVTGGESGMKIRSAESWRGAQSYESARMQMSDSRQ
jgi:N-acetylneuraminic acid mutarotase